MVVILDPQAAQYLETFQSLTPNEQKIATQALEQVTKVEAVDSAADALANTITGKSFSRQERIGNVMNLWAISQIYKWTEIQKLNSQIWSITYSVISLLTQKGQPLF